jgi:hypothetical protein
MSPNKHLIKQAIRDFQWSLGAVLAASEAKHSSGSYELKQTQMMHATLRREWSKLEELVLGEDEQG